MSRTIGGWGRSNRFDASRERKRYRARPQEDSSARNDRPLFPELARRLPLLLLSALVSMPIASGGAGERTNELFLASAGGGKRAAIPVSGGGGVDLGAVGRALGLDPSSVRLNGHFVSRGPHLVSSLTWGSLLSFFAARGLPAGASELDPVVVQGRPALASGMQFSPVLEDGDHLAFKRKVTLEDEHLLKKNRVNGGNASFQGVGDGYPSDDDSLCIKRRLKLEDDSSSKKRKISDCSSGLMHESSNSQNGFSLGCINGHGKRMRQDDLVPVFSCKRVR